MMYPKGLDFDVSQEKLLFRAPHLFFFPKRNNLSATKKVPGGEMNLVSIPWILFPSPAKIGSSFRRVEPHLGSSAMLILYPAMLTLKKISPVFNSYCEIASFSTGK